MCDYCDCRSVPLIDALGEDHAELLAMAAAVEESGDPADAAARLAGLLDLLAEHTRLEEVALFPALTEVGAAVGAVTRLLGDHREVDAMAAALTGASGAAWEAGARALLHELRDHIHREEHDVFPAAVRLVSSARWDEVHARAAALA